MTRKFSFYGLLATAVAIGVLFYRVIEPFVFALLFALVLSVLLRPAHTALSQWWNGHQRLAAWVITAAFDVAVFVPLGVVLLMAGIEIQKFALDMVKIAKQASTAAEVEVDGTKQAKSPLDPEVLEDLAWRSVEVVEAAEWVGGILTLPDVEVEEYALAAHDGRRLARIRQRLPGGETFELVQLDDASGLEVSSDQVLDELRQAPRRSLDRAALARAMVQATQDRAGAFTPAWIDVGGVHVRASAAVAPDSLRALISRIRRP